MYLTEFHGTQTTHLAAPAHDVFDLLVDVQRLPEWNAHVHHVIERPDRPLTTGVERVIQMRAMGTRWPSRSRALNVDRAALSFEHRSCSDDGNPSYALWSWQVKPIRAGSTLTRDLDRASEIVLAQTSARQRPTTRPRRRSQSLPRRAQRLSERRLGTDDIAMTRDAQLDLHFCDSTEVCTACRKGRTLHPRPVLSDVPSR
jgi:uncharacterized protein YndB with AHSA1/START domain